MEKKIKVSGMHCKSCEMLIADALSEIKGVSNARADSKKGEVTLDVNNPAALDLAVKAIKKEGYTVVN